MNQQIIDNLEKIRMNYDLSQQDFADKLQITRQTYHKFLTGTRELKASEIVSLRVNFNIDLNSIFLPEYKLLKVEDKVDYELKQLFQDFVAYDIDYNQIRHVIIQKILDNIFSNRTIMASIKQNNRVIAILAEILYFNQKVKKNTIENAKDTLMETIKVSEISIFNKLLKNSVYKKIKKLSNKDCYYLLKFNKLSAEILMSYIPKHDLPLLKKLGFDKIINEIQTKE